MNRQPKRFAHQDQAHVLLRLLCRVSDDQIVLDLLKHHLNLTEAPGAFAEVKPLSAAGAHSSKPVTDTSVSAAEMPTGAETRNIAAGAAAEAAPGTDDTSSVSILAGQGALGTVASGVSAADSAASPVASVPVRGPGPSPAAQGGGSEPSPSPTGDPRVAGTAAEAPEWADSGGGQQSEVGEEQQSTGAERAREQVAGQGGDEAHGAAHDPLRPYRSVAPEQLEVLMRLPHTPVSKPLLPNPSPPSCLPHTHKHRHDQVRDRWSWSWKTRV